MAEKNNDLDSVLIKHISDTFLLIDKLKKESEFKRDKLLDINTMLVHQNLYDTYLNSIFNDILILGQISDQYGFFIQSVMKIYDNKKREIDNELMVIMSRITDNFKC